MKYQIYQSTNSKTMAENPKGISPKNKNDRSEKNGIDREDKPRTPNSNALSSERQEVIEHRIANKYYERDEVLMEVARRILQSDKFKKLNKKI
jgi:hypothetical protein